MCPAHTRLFKLSILARTRRSNDNATTRIDAVKLLLEWLETVYAQLLRHTPLSARVAVCVECRVQECSARWLYCHSIH